MTNFDENFKIHEYLGDIDENAQRSGIGYEIWRRETKQTYSGPYLNDRFHNEGFYTSVNKKCNYFYEGSFYAGIYEGYAKMTFENCTYFEGLFKQNKRFGPGVLTYQDGSQDVGLWNGNSLMRLSRPVLPEWIPSLAITTTGRNKLLKFRKVISLCNENENPSDILAEYFKINPELFEKNLYNVNIHNRNSLFCKRKLYDEEYFGDKSSYIDVVVEPEDVLQLQDMEIQNEISSLNSVNARDFVIKEVITKLLQNVDRLKNYGEEEMKLLKIKNHFIKLLNKQNIKNDNRNSDTMNINIKKLLVKELLAWNNEEISIEMLKHTFLHRNREKIVSFNVRKVIIGDRDEFENPGLVESACIAFLTFCSEGKIKEAKEILHNYSLNPDLVDLKGNAGILYACARDRIGMISVLVEMGANLDIMNDDGLTPLTMTLLRYISILKGIENWETAFLDEEKFCNEEIKSWLQKISFTNIISQSVFTDLQVSNAILFKKDDNFMKFDSNQENLKVSDNLYKILDIVPPNISIQNFQTPYMNENTNKFDKYCLDLSWKKTGKAEFLKRSIEDLSYECDPQLEVIRNTILVLLYFGVDVNVGNVPCPILFLSIFTEDAKIVDGILNSKANPNQIAKQNVTPMHLLVSLPPRLGLIDVCRVLLKHGADLHSRTSNEHWSEEKNWFIGNVGTDVYEGKTPLHLLSIRSDFENDSNEHLNQIVKLLVEHDESILSETYLHHSPLTLAMLRGNINLVSTLLKTGADPNQALEDHMGSPVVLYILNRFENNLPQFEIMKKIMDELFKYMGNPLLPIGYRSNALHVIRDEMQEFAFSGRKRLSKIKNTKTASQKLIRNYLLELAQTAAFRHYQCKALLTIINSILLDIEEEDFYINLAKLLTPEDVIRILIILIQNKIFSINNSLRNHFIVLVTAIIDYVMKFGYKNKKDSITINDYLKSFKDGLDIAAQNPPQDLYELDEKESNYRICFNCGLSTNYILLPCPKCGLIYFCSDSCNRNNNNGKTRHVCQTIFYKTELERYNQEKLGKEPEVESISKRSYPNINVIGIKIIENLMKKEFGENYVSLANPFFGIQKGSTKHSRQCSTRTLKSSSQLKAVENEQEVIRPRNSKRVTLIESEYKESISLESLSLSQHSIPTIIDKKIKKSHSKKKPSSKLKLAISSKKEILNESLKLNKSFVISDTKKKLNKKNDLKVRGSVSSQENVHIPKAYEKLLEKLAEIFPEYDLANLFFPFICFIDGQLHYKFLDQCSYYCSTYSAM